MWQASDGEPSTLFVVVIFMLSPFLIMLGERLTRDAWDAWKRRK